MIDTTGWPSWSKLCLASINCSPDTITRRLTAILPVPSAIGSTWLPAGARPCSDLGWIGGQIDQLEFEPRGLADQRLQRFGILDAGHLDQDALLALADDGDFLGAAADRSGGGRRRGRRSSHSSAPWPSPTRSGSGRCGSNRRPRRPSRARRSAPTGWVSVRSRSTAASSWVGSRTMNDSRPPLVETSPMSIRGSLAAKLGGDRVFHGRSRCLAASAGIGLEQQMASAGKVEPEIDLGARRPGRPFGDLGLGEHAGNREDDAKPRSSGRPPRPSSEENRASSRWPACGFAEHRGSAST